MKAIIVKLLFLCFITISDSFAHEYAVIANKSAPKMTLGQIKAMFLKKTSFTNNTKMVPVNLGSRDKIRTSFEKNILSMNISRLKSYWTKQHYLGQRPPLTMKSEETIKAFVKKVDGAVGYIGASRVDGSVKIIYKWSD